MASQVNNFDFKSHLVTGNNRALKFGLVRSSKIVNIAIIKRPVTALECEYA